MKPRNKSTAVVASRAMPPDALDYFPTHPWATRALFEHVLHDKGRSLRAASVWEPACGQGHMGEVLKGRVGNVILSDCFDYGVFAEVADFLWPVTRYECDWIITNPPFRLAQEFIEKALTIARVGVAMLVRLQFVEGQGRFNDLFSKTPPTVIAQFAERVSLVPGCLDPKANLPTAYCWMVWGPDHGIGCATRFVWIPPCRDELTQPGDYVSILPGAEVPAPLFEGDAA